MVLEKALTSEITWGSFFDPFNLLQVNQPEDARRAQI
jgi:hypothetical protein